MPYQTGSATSAANLKAIIKTFAGANGFTITGDVLSVANNYTKLVDAIAIRDHPSTDIGALEYNFLGLVNSRTGLFVGEQSPTYNTATTSCCINILSSSWPVTYHLFVHSNPAEVFCVLQYGADYHSWLSFGDIRKSTSLYTGGNYVTASQSSAMVYLNRSLQPRDIGQELLWSETGGFFLYNVFDNTNGDWRSSFCYISTDSINWGIQATSKTVRLDPRLSKLLANSPNIWNNATILIPIRLAVEVASGFMMDIGDVPHARLCRIDNINPGDIITLGPDKWKVFPFCRKDTQYRTGYERVIYSSESYAANSPTIIASPWQHGPRTGTYAIAIRYDGP